jgi:hypothetical protein
MFDFDIVYYIKVLHLNIKILIYLNSFAMGVYVFRSRHTDVIKIGHYSKNNAWSRVAHRGFYSCICPSEIREKVSVGDLELLYWFPSLNSKDEKKIHKSLVDFNVCGEWFHLDALEKIPELVSLENMVDSCSLEEALATRRRL